MSRRSTLREQQALVGRHIAVGVPVWTLLLVALYRWLPPPEHVDAPLDRLILALRCDAVAALTLFAGVQVIATQRRRSEAIDPLAGKESQRMRVHARYVQNTLEQLLLFVLGTAALSTYLDAPAARILPALTVLFVAARALFWIGYLVTPPARAFGMVGTFVINFTAHAGVIYFTARAVVS